MVKEGSFIAGDEQQEFTFTPMVGRFICLQSLSSQKSDPFASIAELHILNDKGKALSRDRWKIGSVDSEELSAEDAEADFTAACDGFAK